MNFTKQFSENTLKTAAMLLFVLFGCSGNSSTNPPGAIILHATDFLMPNRVGSQTLFRVVNIAADTNGFSDTSFRGTVSYTVADTAFRFTPNIRAILIHVGGTDSAGTKYGNDSMYVFATGGEIRLSTYFEDSVGRRLIAEPVRAGATFKRTNDTLSASVVTIESTNFPLTTALRTFSAVKTVRKFLSVIEDTKREIIAENYLAAGHFLVKQQTAEIITTISTGRSSTNITRYDLFYKNF